ncbi:MAG: nuclear transport factor 2 family protein [Flavobacteriaceae bacterium]|nr:nuclear transport factor 2 family protein [Flavobacteriaceae bacterium]
MRNSIISTLIFFFSNIIIGQIAPDSKLFMTLKTQDSLLFERGFNRCDIDYLKTVISADLKFYHDQSGIQNAKGFFESIRKNICSNSKSKPVRKLNSNSLEVYPLYNNGKLYGAIQKGVHAFYLREEDKADVFTSKARFTHVWLLEDQIWKINQVLSYDHKSD